MNKKTLEVYRYAQVYGVEAAHTKFPRSQTLIPKAVQQYGNIPKNLPYNSKQADFIAESRAQGFSFPRIHINLNKLHGSIIPVPIMKAWLKIRNDKILKQKKLVIKDHPNDNPVIHPFLLTFTVK